MTTLERSALGALKLLGSGGQGSVYRAPKVQINFAASVAFKEYKPAWRNGVDFGALEAMAAFLEARSFGEGSEMVARVAWPAKVVTAAGVPVGFVMAEVPDAFAYALRLPSGADKRELAQFQLLLNPEAYLARVGLAVSERDRYLLGAEVAESLAILHGHGIAVGDLSPKNILFSLTPNPRCFFVDADAMRLSGRGALPQAETPDWEISTVSSEELATKATDRYKLGLLVLRLLAGDQSTRDPRSLPRSAPAAIRDLVVRALDRGPTYRPAAADWVAPLRAASASASTALPVLAAQRPSGPTTPPQPAPRPVAPAPGAHVQAPAPYTGPSVSRPLGSPTPAAYVQAPAPRPTASPATARPTQLPSWVGVSSAAAAPPLRASRTWPATPNALRPTAPSRMSRPLSIIVFASAALITAATWMAPSVERITGGVSPEVRWETGFGADQPLVALTTVCMCLAALLHLVGARFRRLFSAGLAAGVSGACIWTVADVARNWTQLGVGPGWYLLLAAMILAVAGGLVQLFVR